MMIGVMTDMTDMTVMSVMTAEVALLLVMLAIKIAVMGFMTVGETRESRADTVTKTGAGAIMKRRVHQYHIEAAMGNRRPFQGS